MTSVLPLAGGRSPGWIRLRARNVYRRPLLVGGVAGAVFVVTLIALVGIPRGAQRTAQALAPKPGERRDTASILQSIAATNARVRSAEQALARAREVVLGAARTTALDTLSPELRARRDSLAAAAANLSRLLERAEDAPLPASYRALGAAPEMQGIPRVAQLLDTLADIERSRAEFGAVGGVDPIFVALTTRATRIGKMIQDIAETKRIQLRRQVDALTPPVRPVNTADTLPLAAVLDSANAAAALELRQLAQARLVNQALDERAAQARRAAAIGASVPAMLAASLVLGLAVGFGVAFVAELRNPRIADAGEAESVAGANVLVTIGITVALPERARRRADHEVPPLIDQISDAYRLLYTQLADRSFNLPLLTVVGDEPFVTATVAANIAATVARQVRTTILVDTDFERHSVASVVRARAVPGVADVLSGLAEWPEALGSVIIGRGRTMDVLTSGSFGGAPIPDGEQGSEAFAQLLEHLTRRYECVIVSAPRSRSGAVFAVGAAAGVVVCARTARTPVTALQELATALRARGTLIRGLVVWDREDPVAPTITTLP